MNEDFNIVLKNIEAFKRKFFFVKLIRGFLTFTIFFIVFYSLFILLEFEFFLPPSVRKIVLYTSIIFFVLFFTHSIVLPVFKIIGFAKQNEKIKISTIINKYFPEIKDKLINVLELNSLKENAYSLNIVNAAISQKSKELKLFNFAKAIHLQDIKWLLYYFLISFSIVISVYIINSSVIIEPGKRILNFNYKYIKPAPFSFELLSKNMKVKKGSALNIQVTCSGNDLPSVVYVNIEGNNYLMKRGNNNIFEYELSSVINNLQFYFTDLKYTSVLYNIEIISVPILNSYTVEVKPPLYTKIKEEKFENIGDIKIPVGSKVIWNFYCYDTDSLEVQSKGSMPVLAGKSGKNLFQTEKVFYKPEIYEILIKNKETNFEKSIIGNIEIIEDLYPEINVTQVLDSSFLTRYFFEGEIKDDYGFSELRFHIKGEKLDSVVVIPIIKELNGQDFYFAFDFSTLKGVEKAITYYFSVTDNDMINGAKITLSDSYVFSFPSDEEIAEKGKEDYKNMDKLLLDSKILTQKIQSEIKELQLKSLNNDINNWDKTEMVKDIISKKNNLENILDKLAKLNKEDNAYQNTFDQQSENLTEKQKQIEKLLDDVMTDELKKLLEEFNKLAEEFNNKKFNDVNKKLELSLDDLTKQLDRNIEMLKRMKIEKQIEDLVQKINEIKNNEEKEAGIISETKDFIKSENVVNKDISEMDIISEKINEIQSENNELKKPLIFDDFHKEQEDIRESFKNTQQSLKRKNRKESSVNMTQTAKQLEYLSFEIRRLLEANERESKGENIITIKRILKNLIYISENQEEVLKKIAVIPDNDPTFRNLKKQQIIFLEQFQTIKDSLYALENRSPQIGSYINEEIVAIVLNLDEASKRMEENDFLQSSINQRMVITSANNLALFLSDLIQKMENQTNSGNENESNEDCNNGKTGKKLGSIKKSAGSLKEQLQDIIEKLKNGQGKNLSKDMSESLMQHELMQKMLRDLINSDGLGKEGRNSLQQVDQLLDQNRKEIMNKMFSKTLLDRNNEILSKLLEAEKSETERDLENKRESNTADEQFYSNPAKLFKNNYINKTSLENLQRNSLKLSNYYLEKQRNYLEKSSLNDSQ
jgi:hypothetical protein